MTIVGGLIDCLLSVFDEIMNNISSGYRNRGQCSTSDRIGEQGDFNGDNIHLV